jgi:hypothetical protein
MLEISKASMLVLFPLVLEKSVNVKNILVHPFLHLLHCEVYLVYLFFSLV